MRVVRPVTITDSNLISTNVPETDYTAYNAATTYATGARCILVSTHRIYESLQNANLNHNPPDNLAGATPWWLEVGATNAWRMLDDSVGSQTSNPGSITLSLDTSSINSVTLINMDATSVAISEIDNSDSSVVFSEVFDLINSSSIIDLYTYFFEQFNYTKNLTIEIPFYSDSTTSITLVNGGGTVKCGELVIGNHLYLGCTQFGASIGITDYSVKQVDEFGNYSILQRAFSKRGNFDVVVQNSQLESLITTLSDYRAVPAIWIPTTESTLQSPLLIYGFYKDFNIVIQYATESTCSLEIEGLI